MSTIHDERGVILTWLLRVVVILAILAVLAFDAGSIAVNRVTLDTDADEVAIAISVTIGSTPTELFTDNEIFLMARGEVEDPANGIAGARVAKKGTFVDDTGVVHVRLRRKAKTLLAHYVSPLRGAINGSGDGSAGTN